MINHIISVEKYKTSLVSVWKDINWELDKKLKFDHTTKWYMHKLETILLNAMPKILRCKQIP